MATSSLLSACWIITGLLVAVTAIRGEASASKAKTSCEPPAPAGFQEVPVVSAVAFGCILAAMVIAALNSPLPSSAPHHHRTVDGSCAYTGGEVRVRVAMEPSPLHLRGAPSRLFSDC